MCCWRKLSGPQAVHVWWTRSDALGPWSQLEISITPLEGFTPFYLLPFFFQQIDFWLLACNQLGALWLASSSTLILRRQVAVGDWWWWGCGLCFQMSNSQWSSFIVPRYWYLCCPNSLGLIVAWTTFWIHRTPNNHCI